MLNILSRKEKNRSFRKVAAAVKRNVRNFVLLQMEARVYNSYFLYTDQYLTIFSQTIQCILVTGLVVVLVSLLLLPDGLAATCAVLSIMSTLLGTLGFMSLWGIVLDGITLINLIMCIGFSVDFTAHFCYYYIEVKSHAQQEQQGGSSSGDQVTLVENTLLAVKKPILQVSHMNNKHTEYVCLN
jgi:predicted RND superfamily exporter protein